MVHTRYKIHAHIQDIPLQAIGLGDPTTSPSHLTSSIPHQNQPTIRTHPLPVACCPLSVVRCQSLPSITLPTNYPYLHLFPLTNTTLHTLHYTTLHNFFDLDLILLTSTCTHLHTLTHTILFNTTLYIRPRFLYAYASEYAPIHTNILTTLPSHLNHPAFCIFEA